ncbi:MAG: hypothetical protein V5A36_05370 [Natronomonas sp.]
MTQYTTDGDDDDGRLRQFERNRYFHGKLMTARDMQLEQEYHRDRLDTLSQHLLGTGIVCGLETTVEEDEGTLEVTVQPGLAIDSRGRPVVVEQRTTDEIDLSGIADEVSLYLEYDNCVKETVPVPGSEDACEEECTYNRIREVFEITHNPGPPEEQKSIRHVMFPSSADFDLAAGESQPAPTHDELHRAARSYYEDEADKLRGCDTGHDDSVFLGYFTTSGDSPWTRQTNGEPRPHVFTNDMLYAAIARHAADFENPHEVTLEVDEPETGAVVRVRDSATPDGNVELRSPDETVAIDADANTKRVDLQVAERLLETIEDLEDRLDRHDRYALERSLWCTCQSFSTVHRQFGIEAAGKIAEQAREAVTEEVYEEPAAYLEVLAGGDDPGLFGLQRHVGDALSERGDIEGLERYVAAVERLGEVIEETESTLELARAQDRVCNMAACIEAGDEEPQEPKLDLRTSLEAKMEIYTQVAEQFDSKAAMAVVEQVRDELDAGAGEDAEAYREAVESLLDPEKAILQELQSRITAASAKRYAVAVGGLQTALNEEASIAELVDAQDAITDAAGDLEPGGGIEVDVSLRPQNVTVTELNEEIVEINDPNELEKLLLAEMTTEDRITSERAISKQLDTLGE